MSIFFGDIPVSEWDDLDGRTLLIRVSSEEDGNKGLYAYDPIDNIMYVLVEKN